MAIVLPFLHSQQVSVSSGQFASAPVETSDAFLDQVVHLYDFHDHLVLFLWMQNCWVVHVKSYVEMVKQVP
jgi:hypothetical protein